MEKDLYQDQDLDPDSDPNLVKDQVIDLHPDPDLEPHLSCLLKLVFIISFSFLKWKRIYTKTKT